MNKYRRRRHRCRRQFASTGSLHLFCIQSSIFYTLKTLMYVMSIARWIHQHTLSLFLSFSLVHTMSPFLSDLLVWIVSAFGYCRCSIVLVVSPFTLKPLDSRARIFWLARVMCVLLCSSLLVFLAPQPYAGASNAKRFTLHVRLCEQCWAVTMFCFTAATNTHTHTDRHRESIEFWFIWSLWKK